MEHTVGRPTEASADRQYNTGPELAKLEELEVTGYVAEVYKRSDGAAPPAAQSEALAAVRAGPELTEARWAALPQNEQGYFDKAAFVYVGVADDYRCPGGQRRPLGKRSTDCTRAGKIVRRHYAGRACGTCPHTAGGGRPPARGCRVNRDEPEPYRERMRARLASETGRRRYALRKPTVEPRIGRIKPGLGVRRFQRPGLVKVARDTRSV